MRNRNNKNETKKVAVAPPKDKEATLADIVAYQKRRLQSAEPQTTSSALYFIFAFILALIVAALLENYDQLYTTSSSASQPKQVTKRNTPITKIKWTNTSKSMATELAEKRIPVVIKGSPVKALSEWRPTYLAQSITTLSNVKVHTNKDIVFYEDSAPMVLPEYLSSSTKLNHAKSYWKRSKQTVKRMSTEEFFQKASEQLDDSYYYWNGDILGTKLNRDIQPFDFLSPNGKPEYIHLWMGEKGVTARIHIADTHYDVEHNFYVQIYGTKRWTLWPPEMHKQLHLFPRLSPNYRQSQVDYDHPDINQYPLFTQENSYQVVLEEGDVLYLPPFWFHRVESLDSPADNVIISVNVWSPSADQKAMEEVYVNYAYSSRHLLPEVKQHLPKDLADKSALLITLVTYLKLAQTEIFGTNSVIEDLYTSRYAPIFSRLPKQQSDFMCPPNIGTACKLPSNGQDIPVGLQHLLKSYIRPLKEAFDNVGSSGVKEIHFGNYVEDLVAWQVDMENVDLFLRDCFRT